MDPSVYNHTWYYYLNNPNKHSLFKEFPRFLSYKTYNGELIISYSGTYISNMITGQTNTKSVKMFAYFSTYFEFYQYQQKFPRQEQCFYEVILGNSSQKPRFDIDIDDNSNIEDQIINCVIDGINQVFNSLNIPLNPQRDILLYNSHGASKKSFHIVIDNYCHVNYLEAKAFYQRVISYIPISYLKYIDKSVYNNVQNFRIIGSQKYGSNRPKQFMDQWKWYDQTITYQPADTMTPYTHLRCSLISFTETCILLPIICDLKIISSPIPKDITLEQSDIDHIISLLLLSHNHIDTPENYQQSLDDKLGLKISQVSNNNLITLKRLRPTFCIICNRIHDNENPYIYIQNNGDIYYNCRRCNSSYNIGMLSSLNISTNIQQDNNVDDNPLISEVLGKVIQPVMPCVHDDETNKRLLSNVHSKIIIPSLHDNETNKRLLSRPCNRVQSSNHKQSKRPLILNQTSSHKQDKIPLILDQTYQLSYYSIKKN